MSPEEKKEAIAAVMNLFHDVGDKTLREELDTKRKIYLTTRGQSADGTHEQTIKITFDWTDDKTLKLVTPVEIILKEK